MNYAMVGMTFPDTATITLNGEDVSQKYSWLCVCVPEGIGIRYKEPFRNDPDSGEEAIEVVRGKFGLSPKSRADARHEEQLKAYHETQ